MRYNRRMTRAVVALLVSISMLMIGCFPHDAGKRRIAKIAEGGSLVTGIAISAFANTGADCDEMAMAGVETSCRTNAKILSTIGVTLILAGLIGFIATVSTAEDEDKTSAVTTQVDKTDTSQVKLPPGVKTPAQTPGEAAGSASGEATGSADATGSGAPPAPAPQP